MGQATSNVNGSGKPAARTVAIVLAALFAIATPVAQQLHAFGLSAAEFSHSGDSTLRAEGFAFAIWGVIYAGLVLYAVVQAIPRTGESEGLVRFGWPSVVAMSGCGFWLIAAAVDARWLTVVLILVSALALVVPLWRDHLSARAAPIFIVAPLGLLGGWLTVASALNTLTVLTSFGYVPPGQALGWAIGGEVVVLVVAIAVFVRSRNIFYIAAIAWGFLGVAVAEYSGKPLASVLAGAAGLVLVVLGVRQSLRGQWHDR